MANNIWNAIVLWDTNEKEYLNKIITRVSSLYRMLMMRGFFLSIYIYSIGVGLLVGWGEKNICIRPVSSSSCRLYSRVHWTPATLQHTQEQNPKKNAKNSKWKIVRFFIDKWMRIFNTQVASTVRVVSNSIHLGKSVFFTRFFIEQLFLYFWLLNWVGQRVCRISFLISKTGSTHLMGIAALLIK